MVKRLTGLFVNATILLALSASPATAAAITVNLDPGPDGSSFVYKTWLFSELAGTRYDGQTLSVDVQFGALLVAPLLSIDLALNQASGLGTWPTTGFSVSGYLIGEAASASQAMPLSMEMPGQLNPHWPFFLADGQPYVPATTGYNFSVKGAASPTLIAPIIFSGIHFDITMPNTTDWLVGSRLTMADYGSGGYMRQYVDAPISVSPDVLPIYAVPDGGSSIALMIIGLIGLAGIRTLST